MRHIDFNEARDAASGFISQNASLIGESLSIIDRQTVEFDRGWIFFYNTLRYLDKGDELARLAGNGPIFVSRSGRVFELPSAVPWQESVDDVLEYP